MKKRFGFTRGALAALTGLVLGIAIAVVLVLNRQAPTRVESDAAAATLTIIEAQEVPFRFEARGHGVARPAETWQATANVPGRVVERHPRLESGMLVRAGTLLLALDPSRYELAIAEAQAELASLAAERTQLEREQGNTERLLALERERLDLAAQELERIERLAEQGSVSRSRRDEQRRATVAQRRAVAALENEMALIPARRTRLEAQSERAATRLAQARQDLADTRFEAPYDLRISEVSIDRHQHAGAGQPLFRAHGIAAAEVEAHVPLAMLRRLMGSVLRAAPAPDAFDIGERLDFSAIDAEVRLAGAEQVRWPARVARVASGLDPKTRTARVVVTVQAPYEGVAPPARPALQPGMYVRVRLAASSPQPLLVVPASAVYEGAVYRVDDEQRLERRRVQVAFEQNDLAVIAHGLAPGDRVIVDDPGVVPEGMAVRARRDEVLEQAVRARARGEAP